MKFLVFGATGAQGGAVVDALLAAGLNATDICGVTRNPKSDSSAKKIDAKGITAVKGDLSSLTSVKDALVTSKAEAIWFFTDYYGAGSAAAETLQGKNVVDAIKACGGDQIKHVVFSSVGDADNCPKTIDHFWSKAAVEDYMQKELEGTGITWAILRPVAFLDNYDNAAVRNPLTKGKVTGLCRADTKLKLISTVDIGKASAVLLQNPDTYAGKKIEAAGCEYTGTELAQILTEVSGTPCKYKMLPRWLLWLFMRDLYHMSRWFDEDGYSANIDEFKKDIVPDAMNARDWFKGKAQWSNGEKFVTGE